MPRGWNGLRRLKPRAIGAGLAAAMTLGTAGVALGWASWAEKPDSTTQFALPSGTVCEYRLVLREDADEDVAATVQAGH